MAYYGSYLRRDKLWICMEYCGGSSLQDIYHSEWIQQFSIFRALKLTSRTTDVKRGPINVEFIQIGRGCSVLWVI